MDFLISQQYLIERTSIQTDVKELPRVFHCVESFYILPLLGQQLFDRFKAHVSGAVTPVLTAEENKTFNLVQYYFAIMAEHELCFNLFEITNRGLHVEGANPALELIKLKRSELLAKAETLKAQILGFTTPEQAAPTDYASLVFDHSPRLVLGR